MFLTLLMEAVLGGVVETLSGAAIGQAPHVAKRIQRAVDLVERQEVTDVEAAIRAAVDAARSDLLADFDDDLYSGDPDAATADVLALLNHPPFAEEVTHKLLYRGQPDFERLRQAYLDLTEADTSERWTALELPLRDFFDAVERHLLVDGTVGPLLRHLQQAKSLANLENTNQAIARGTALIQANLARIEVSGEETADGIQQLIALSHEQNATLRHVALFLRENAGRSVHTNGDLVNRDKIIHIYHVYQSAPGQPEGLEHQLRVSLCSRPHPSWVASVF